ncbi:MAG: enoyl-ACP reductase [Betaproteobacteria bacterium]|nr:MAG: enoyl-ACP reductase [Betaproteobacteria bacterium]
MRMLEGKKILVTGMLSNRSIAYGVAKAMHREGAKLAFTYQSENIRERVESLTPEFGPNLIFPCDVTSDEDIATLFEQLGESWGNLDGIVHAIAYAPREALSGDFHETVTRENFSITHDISSYSLAALVKGGLPMMRGRKAAVVAMTFLGAVRAVPNYNVMGLAKASLEACVRYLAFSLGPIGIRINGISAGPIKTLAASGVGSFKKLLDHVQTNSPLRRNVTAEEVGNTAAFLCSDLASGINGEITYVDGGFGISGLARDQ